MKEHEINLIALLFEILLKWRMILISMVIGAVLLGGYSYWESTNSTTVQEGIGETIKENKITTSEKRHVELILEYETYGEYCDNSLLMKIDAQNVPKTELILSVQTGDTKNKNTIVATYTRLLATGMTDWLIQSGMKAEEAAQVKELIAVENDNGIQGHSFERTDKENVYITVMHIDEKRCQELVEQVKKFVVTQKSIVDSNYGAHEITWVSEIYATEVDADLLAKQRSILSSAISENYNVKGWITSFSELEKEYYNMLRNNEISEGVGEDEAVPQAHVVADNAPSISIKYVILGVILFAFMYVFFVFMVYIFNNKLRANDNMTELYDIPQFGIISMTKEKKKVMAFIDAWIITLRDRNKRKFTEEEAKEIVAVAIKMAVKKSDSKDVCLIGCDVKKQIEDICGSIKVLLEKEGIKVSVLDNVLYNAEEMEKLSDAGNAVIIEKTGATMYDEVAKELELLKRYNINILGGVLVD